MKLNIFIFAILTFCILPIFADENNSNTEETQTNIAMNGSGIRPRENTNNIKCYYINGNIYIELSESEGDATLTITNQFNGEAIQTSFSTTCLYSINIGTETGIYEIVIETSVGGEYIGYLQI